MIQNDGTVIQEIYYGYDGMVVPYMYYFYGERASDNCGVSVNDAWYYNCAYYDNNYLYWSTFDVKTQDVVTLYAIDADRTGSAYELGQFADGVWPMGGLYQMDTDAADESTKLEESLASAMGREIAPAEIQLVAKEFPVKEVKAGGSLNAASASAPVAPLSSGMTGCESNTFTVTVTAKVDEDGSVDANNGFSTVTYDAEISGSVDKEPTCTESGMMLYVAVYGEYDEGMYEVIPALGHDWTDPVFNWSEDHTACAVTYTCANGCGETDTHDCEVTAETTEATCEDDGRTVYTAAYGEDTDVVEVVIPATGHDYQEGSCTVCGDTDYEYWRDTVKETVVKIVRKISKLIGWLIGLNPKP